MLSEVVTAALDHAAATAPLGYPLDTRLLMVALMRLDASADWSRIWLHGRSLEVADTTYVADPQRAYVAYWRGRPMTQSCDQAIRAAQHLATSYAMDTVSTGMLAIALINDPRSAAAISLGISSAAEHSQQLQLMQEDLLGIELRDFGTAAGTAFATSTGAPAPVPPRPPNQGRVGTLFYALAIMAIFGIGAVRAAAEQKSTASGWIMVGIAFWTPLLLWINVLIRRELKYRWHIVVIGSAITLAGVFIGLMTIR